MNETEAIIAEAKAGHYRAVVGKLNNLIARVDARLEDLRNPIGADRGYGLTEIGKGRLEAFEEVAGWLKGDDA